MYLIQFRKGEYINAEDIQYLDIGGGQITFTLKNVTETYHVQPEYIKEFIDRMTYLNDSAIPLDYP